MRGRRLPVGAECVPGGGVDIRVWAPDRTRVRVLIEGGGSGATDLAPSAGGYHEGRFAGEAGADYRLLLDDDPTPYPDPASRWQPGGPFGPSRVVDPASFAWTDGGWPGLDPARQVLYEMHVGTFTPEGTWAAAALRLADLAALGVTAVAMMPVADFAGSFGWGYDGVDLFAPTHLYGEPDDLRRFVDTAHGLGLGVILDVVYNHFGPSGCFLRRFADAYFTDRHANEWGDAINFDGLGAEGSRAFFVANAGYWIAEFHMDGLRLDATQQMFDLSPRHVLIDIAERARAEAGGRRVFLIAENEAQEARLVQRAGGGFGLDALWNDDFHHSATVALTGRHPAYFSDYRGLPQEFVSSAKRGFLYQGQYFGHQGQPRGTPGAGLPPHAFVHYLENHDQVANSATGARLSSRTSAARLRAMTAVLLLGPATPMLFQGQEFASSVPFLYFADQSPELARAVREGRAEFLSQFPALAGDAARERLADPGDPRTFVRCKLIPEERERHRPALRLHTDLLRLRRSEAAFDPEQRHGFDGAVLGDAAFALRWFAEAGDRLLIVNLGRDARLEPMPEPLLAPPRGTRWRQLWSSEDVLYGGDGVPPFVAETAWRLTGESATLLEPVTPVPSPG